MGNLTLGPLALIGPAPSQMSKCSDLVAHTTEINQTTKYELFRHKNCLLMFSFIYLNSIDKIQNHLTSVIQEGSFAFIR